MSKHLLTIIVLLLSTSVYSQNLDVGIRIQKTHGMYWENGITAQYQFENFKPINFSVGISYITSRLGTAMGTNALKQDSYIANANWFFGKKAKPFKVYGRLNMGYFHAEEINDIFQDVPNTAFMFAPEFGLRYQFKQIPLSLNLGSGYYLFTGEDGTSPGTFQPLYYHLDICYTLNLSKE